ncbi:PA3371 family protein [Stutzerimonas stutzeri]|uniref:PA3371 family protein n=1 Tax=Stutzerimonas stutzeri TaxID=316 RepID=UPI001C2E77A0|nr:PA3371 family protein [Stutzerimonas stutzeri]
MSIYGYLFVMLSVACGTLSFGAELTETWEAVAECGTALFSTLFLVSLVMGRRIKFDPILR